MERDTKNTTTRLKADVFSHVTKDPKKAKQMLRYGAKGDQVTILSDKGEVLVVEDITGNRYPVKREDIK